MKVLHLGKLCPPNEGGIEIFSYDLLEYLNSVGVKADLLCFGLETREAVYTGSMYKAIENTVKFVKEGGYLIIAIYKYAPSSPTWLKIKKFYNEHKLIQPLLELLYGSYVVLRYIVRRKTFKLRRERGMHVFYDAIDWIGGYPYEFACFDEIRAFVEDFGFELIKAPTKLPCGKNLKAGIFGMLRGLIRVVMNLCSKRANHVQNSGILGF